MAKDKKPSDDPSDPPEETRAQVRVDGKQRPRRRGDEGRPLCPACSTPEVPALMTASGTRGLKTYYRCGECGLTDERVDYSKIPPQLRRPRGGNRDDLGLR